VLLEAVRQGVGQFTWRDYFAYAGGWDEAKQRYLGLVAGQAGGQIVLDGQSLIVKPEAAQRQIEADEAEQRRLEEERRRRETETQGVRRGGAEDWQRGAPGGGSGAETVDKDSTLRLTKKGRRFYGTVELNATRIGRDAGQIAETIIQHPTTLPNAKVTLTLEIHADLPDGASDHIIRTVTENAHTLKVKDFSFEEA
jgi:hypothetical protein